MKIKQLAEDFRVTELLTPTLGDGPYIVFTLTKKGMGTLDAVQKLADIWKVPSRFIGFAGLADKHAVTTQYCSVKNVSKDGIANTQTNNLTLKVLGTAPDPVRVGVHTANQFSIVVREIDALPEKKTVFLNTFGDQRFSTHNAAITKALILADYLTAVKHILETHPPAQDLIV
ncbi:MAG: tRNA pseudouridine(13) synthase TruD, partial [Nanoarchaeota archaeon]